MEKEHFKWKEQLEHSPHGWMKNGKLDWEMASEAWCEMGLGGKLQPNVPGQ